MLRPASSADGLLGKQNLYEHSVRVPFILRGPGVPRGERRDTLAYSLDLYATLCELTGVPAPAGLDSRSLVPAFRSEAPAVRDEVFAVYMDCQRMVTDGRWKRIVYYVEGAERVQLFDLASDPHELHNLADDPASGGHLGRLAARLAQWQEDEGDTWMRATLAVPAAEEPADRE